MYTLAHTLKYTPTFKLGWCIGYTMKTSIIGLVMGVISCMMVLGGINNNTANASTSTRETIIFLIGDRLCVDQMNYAEMFTNAMVVCSRENTWQVAHGHYYGFEQYYNVVYLTPQNLSPIGEAYYAGDEHGATRYAYASWTPEPDLMKDVVRHELQHLTCVCLYTPDGYHGSQEKGAMSTS